MSTLIQKGNFYDVKAALSRLKRDYTPEEYIKIFQENETIPAIQLEIGNIYRDECFSKYGLEFSIEKSDEYFLKAILSETSKNQIPLEQPYVETLINHKDMEELMALNKADTPMATYALFLIYARDLHIPYLKDDTKTALKKFAEAPIDHNLARECLRKLESNMFFISDIKSLKRLLDEFENSPSPDQKNCKF